MIRAWIRYLFLLFIGSGLYIFYVGYTSYFLFLFILSLPMISILLYVLGIWHLELQVHSVSKQIEQGTTQDIILRSRTNSWIPVAKIAANIQLYNHFHHTAHTETIFFTSEGDFRDVAFAYDFPTCGKYTITVQSLYVYDILHLFKKRKKINSTLSIFVLPKHRKMQEEFVFTPQLGEEEFDKHRPGNDPSETFDVHEYREGDSIHKIHWKLTAKLDKMMVRESSMPIAKNVKLYFDLYGTSIDGDIILGQVYGCSLQLLATHFDHDIFQYEVGTCVQVVHITNKEELVNFLCSMLSKRVSLSATSYLSQLPLQDDMMLIQKNKICTKANQKGVEQHAPTK